jgi:hypothetical protein
MQVSLVPERLHHWVLQVCPRPKVFRHRVSLVPARATSLEASASLELLQPMQKLQLHL